LKLNFILDNEGLAFVINLLWKFGRDCMVSSGVLDNKTLVTFHSLEDMRLLYSPLSNICPFLILLARAFCVLLGMGRLPSGLPVICELLDEVGFYGGRLLQGRLAIQLRRLFGIRFEGQ
jgi:hypothetical protein